MDRGSKIVAEDKFDSRLSIIPDVMLPIGRSTPGAVAAIMARPGQPGPTSESQKEVAGDAEMDTALDGHVAQGPGL